LLFCSPFTRVNLLIAIPPKSMFLTPLYRLFDCRNLTIRLPLIIFRTGPTSITT
jgi:hypothetical protein